MEARVRAGGAIPATIAILDGEVKIGLTDAEIEHLARPALAKDAGRGIHDAHGILKVSRRDYPVAIAQKRDGATTVAGTMIAAGWAGIQVFATGGIGGVHRSLGTRSGHAQQAEGRHLTTDDWRLSTPLDISADLPELARTPVIVVCAGAKAILDLPATLEWLETHGVPVVGYGTDEFPAFYSRESSLQLEARADSPAEVAAIARAMWGMGFGGGLLVCVPCPAEAARPREEMESAITTALREAEAQGVRGKAVTPFLLARVSELTHGESKAANLALLENNARVAAEIGKALSS